MNHNRRIRNIAIVGILLLAVIFILYRTNVLGGKDEAETTAAPSAAPKGSPFGQGPVPVKAMRITKGALDDYILVNGSTSPNEEVTISSEVPGKVAKILFKEGTTVKKGTPLVQLDVSELQAERKRLEVQKELNIKIAERLKALYEREGVSLQEYEVAKAEVEKVKAEIALNDAQVEKRTIRAPFSGKLGLRQISEGSYLSPGSPIISLVNINPIQLEFSVPERYSQVVKPGTRVQFKLDGVAGNFNATVAAAEPNIDAATRTYKLKASAPNDRGLILPGAFSTVTVSLQSYAATIMIPTESVVPELGGKKVYVYRNGKAQPVNIETGLRQDADIQVISGLQEGDTLITSGVLQIKPGADVTITSMQ
jgi:membrane fusion protein (multidrug efflux system)